MVNTHKVASADELKTSGDRVVTEIKGREIAVFNVEGEYYAVLNFCVHQNGPLCEGGLIKGEFNSGEDVDFWEFNNERKMISCPWHNWQFDIETGENMNDSRYKVPTYDIEVVDGELFLSL